MKSTGKPAALVFALLLAVQTAAAGGFTISPGGNILVFHLKEPEYNTSFSAPNGTFASVVASDTYVAFDRYVLSLKPLDYRGVAVDVSGTSGNLTVDVSSSSAGVLWVLGGFSPLTNVSVYDDGLFYDVFSSNSSGFIAFTNSPSGVYVFEENGTLTPTTSTTTTTLETGGGGGRRSTTTSTIPKATTTTAAPTSSTGTSQPPPTTSQPATRPTSQTTVVEPHGAVSTTLGGHMTNPPATTPENGVSAIPPANMPTTLPFYFIIVSVGLVLLMALAAVGVILLGRRPPKQKPSRLGGV
jgi:hypothetical protein